MDWKGRRSALQVWGVAVGVRFVDAQVQGGDALKVQDQVDGQGGDTLA